MEERSLRVVATDKTFFNKLTNTLTKFLIPTQIGFNSLKISMKRKLLIKTYETLNAENAPVEKKEELEKRYDDAYTAYLEALDKYVLDTIYKKVKNETATQFESTALSQYYGIVQLKDREYNEYKYRKQKYLLELDNESVKNTAKEKVIEKYNRFYVSKQDSLYKGILKNYSIKLADSTNIYDSSKDWIYVKIFNNEDKFYEFNPGFLGNGIGFLTYQLSTSMHIGVASIHNDFLQHFIDLGFWGYIIWLVSITLVRVLYFGRRDNTDNAIITFMLTLYLVIVSSTDNTMNYPLLTGVLAMLMMGTSFDENVRRNEYKIFGCVSEANAEKKGDSQV